MISSSKVAQKRCLMSSKLRPSALIGPSRSNSSAAVATDHMTESQIAGMPHAIRPSRNVTSISETIASNPNVRLQREPPATGRRTAQRPATRRDGLEADRLDDERREVADERAEPGRDPERGLDVGRVAGRLELREVGLQRRHQQHRQDRQREDRHDDGQHQRLPVPDDDLHPRVEDLPDAQRPQRSPLPRPRRYPSPSAVYAQPPAMAGRITSVSDSPTDVSSPSSTRTSSSLR